MGKFVAVVQPQKVDIHTVHIKPVGWMSIELSIRSSRKLRSQKGIAYSANTYYSYVSQLFLRNSTLVSINRPRSFPSLNWPVKWTDFVLLFSRLVADIWPWIIWLSPSWVHEGLVKKKMALIRIFFPKYFDFPLSAQFYQCLSITDAILLNN
jgi:hypothetical protein